MNKSFNFSKFVPNDKVLNKKVPGNPKYQHVKPTINTGSTVRRQIDELREKEKNCQQKKDEVFYRIKFLIFLKLLLEAAKVKPKLEKTPDGGNSAKESVKSNGNEHPDKILANVLMGIGEIDVANQKKNPSSTVHKLEKFLPYLLLDVRDKEQFMQSHIKTALHYPTALLTRTSGFETEEMKLYKNSSYEIIVLYDDDESIAVRVATTLVQRGYDNIYVLSGGLRHCFKVFPKRPLSHLVTNPSCDQSHGSSPSVSIPEFSQEDVDALEQYVDCSYSGPNARGSSSISRSEVDGKTDKISGQTCKGSSLTYRRDSNSSLKSADQIRQSKSATDTRIKGSKMPPWK